MSKQIPWLRIFVEGAVIVGSILLAFGIQAWWDNHSQRLDVGLELQSVALELVENRGKVLFQLDLMERINDGGNALLRIMESSDENSVEVPDTLVYLSTVVNPTLNASSGAISALIASGRLAFVDNLELSRRLAGLSSRFEEVVENQVSAANLSHTQIRPAIYDYPFNRASNQVGTRFWNAQDRVPGIAMPHESFVDFPNNLGLRGLIGFRNTLASHTIPELERLLLELDELLELLREFT